MAASPDAERIGLVARCGTQYIKRSLMRSAGLHSFLGPPMGHKYTSTRAGCYSHVPSVSDVASPGLLQKECIVATGRRGKTHALDPAMFERPSIDRKGRFYIRDGAVQPRSRFKVLRGVRVESSPHVFFTLERSCFFCSWCSACSPGWVSSGSGV